jgi:nitrite reductase (NO-forming)
MKRELLYLTTFVLLVLLVLVVAGGNIPFVTADPPARPEAPSEPVAADQEYALVTAMRDGRMVYVGVGGEIDGLVNPELVVHAGTRLRVILHNGDGMAHDFSIGELGITTPLISAEGSTAEVVFAVTEGQVGTYDYFCTVSGHRQAGMAGKFVVR